MKNISNRLRVCLHTIITSPWFKRLAWTLGMFMGCLFTAAPAFSQAGQHRPGVYLNYDAAATKYHHIFVDSNNKLYFDGTGGTPSLQFSDYAGTGNRLLYVDASGNVVRSTVDPALTATPGGSTTQLQYNNAGILAGLANAATGNALISAGTSTLPTWGKIGLTTHVSGTLPVANGGTGAATFTANRLLFGNGTSAITNSSNLNFNTSNNGSLLVGTTTAALTSSGRGVVEINGTTESFVGLKVGGSVIGELFANSTGIQLYGESGKNVSIATNAGVRMLIGTSGQIQLNNYTTSSSFSGTTAGYFGFTSSGLMITKSGSDLRTELGLVVGADVQSYDADLSAIAGLATTDGNIIVGNGSTWVAESGSTARISLGLGSISPQNADNVAITGGSITGITDITVSDGGTGVSTLTGGQVLIGNGTSPIFQTSSLVWDNTNTRFGVGTGAPTSTLHAFENTSNTGTTTGLSVYNAGAGDAVAHFLADGTTYSLGVDNSDANKFKISGSSDMGTSDRIIVNSSGAAIPDGIDHGATGVFVKHLPLNIGTWDMSSATGSLTKSVAHGLGVYYINIRSVDVVIFKDDSSLGGDFTTFGDGSVLWDSTNIYLQSRAAGTWDGADYNGSSSNRGYLYITYTTTCTHTVCP